LCGVQLEDVGDGAGEELPVVAHHDETAPEPEDEGLEPRQPVEVEVVGGLVEQQDVVAAEQDGGQRRAGHLAAREPARLRVEQPVAQAEVGAHLGGADVEVGTAEGEPALEGPLVRRGGRVIAAVEGVRGVVQGGVGVAHPRTAAEVGEQRLVRRRSCSCGR
jgi:hypothetical protein